jgi:asparagine synthase (glutamine-hydrolysing)
MPPAKTADMPGITGIIAAGVEQAAVERMTRCMLHEPSYVSGTYANEDAGLCVGWVSHGGSFSDCMPLWNERRDVCLIFSGEDFMSAEDVRQCVGPGCDFRAGSARYLMALYEAMGPQFIEKLNGWFSGLLVDLRRKAVVLFNDRYGLGRVYYHQGPERFFSSEAKSLLEVLPSLRRLDLRGGRNLCLRQRPANRTLFAGISLLPGGSRWSFASNGQISRRGTSVRKRGNDSRQWATSNSTID